MNDLFQAISTGALKRYAKKHDCPIFADNNFHGLYTCMGIVNRRPLSVNNFANSLSTFAKTGQNANQIDFTPFKIPVKSPTVNQLKKSFSNIKYGYTPYVFKFITDVVQRFPGKIYKYIHN